MTTTVERVFAPVATPTAGDRMDRRQRLRLVLVLGSLIGLGPLTIDMYLPALPAIAANLHVDAATVQLTLTGTLLGLAVGQLVIGPISDAVGRRAPLLAGVALHVLASLLCVVAPNVVVLGALRVLQGVGIAAAFVVAMAVVRDLFTGLPAARMFSRLMLVMGVAPVLAPTLGSEVLRWTSWRGVFATLAALGAVLIVVAAVGLPETLPAQRRRGGGIQSTARAYGGLLRDRTFIGVVLAAALAMAAVFGYIAGASFVFQQQYGLDQQEFGFVFGAGAVGMIGATQYNVRLLRRYSPQQILYAALAIGSAASLVLLAVAVTGFGGLPGLLIPLWTVLAAAGLFLPNAPTLALARHGDAAGTAAALLGAVQLGIGAIAAPLVGVVGAGSVGMAIVITAGVLAAAAVLSTMVRPSRLAPIEPAQIEPEPARLGDTGR